MFQRFTAQARDVVGGAYAQARALRSPYVGTEHLLLALLGPSGGNAQRVLQEAGVDAAQVRADIDRLVGSTSAVLTDQDAAALQTLGIDVTTVLARIEQSLGPDALAPPGCPTPRRGLLRRRRWGGQRSTRFGPRARTALELSLHEALALRHDHIGAEHLLLGLLREGEGLAVRILTEAGVDLDALRRATLRTLSAAA